MSIEGGNRIKYFSSIYFVENNKFLKCISNFDGNIPPGRKIGYIVVFRAIFSPKSSRMLVFGISYFASS